jgi:hypothetical protein
MLISVTLLLALLAGCVAIAPSSPSPATPDAAAAPPETPTTRAPASRATAAPPPATETPAAESPGAEAPELGIEPSTLPEAVLAVRDAIAERLGSAPESILVLEAEQVEWPDGCLGAGQPDEMCLMAITPGYRIVLEVDGSEWVVHSNDTGQSFRVVEGAQW